MKPLCRSCHITRQAALDFGSFDSFNRFDPRSVLCDQRLMPNAKVPYQKFWLERGPDAVSTLRSAGLSHFGANEACPVVHP